MAKPPFEVHIWSDVVCPWCYIGKRRFEAALAQFPHRDQVSVSWKAFELDPSAPRSHEGKGTYAERLSRKYGTGVVAAQTMIDRMTATAADEGLTFRFDIARPGNTFDAHRLLHFAASARKQDALKERLLQACFTEGEPIGDAETLVRLAADTGLDQEQARSVVRTDAFSAEVRADEATAKAMGISGVPFFALGGTHGVSGAQTPEVLLQALEQAWNERSDPPALDNGAVCEGDTCGA